MNALLGRRIAAYGLDCLLLFLVLVPTGYLVQRAVGFVPSTGQEVWYTLLVGFSLPAWLYFIYCDRSARGATLGKRILSIRVSTRAGARLSTLQAAGRTAVKLLPWELVHAAGFALSTDMSQLATAQIVGLVTANVLVLVYLGIAVGTGGRASLHDLVLSTEVRLLR